MPSNPKRKTDRGRTPRDVLERAAQAVVDGRKIRSAARDFHVDRMTLTRFVAKQKNNPHPDVGYEAVRKAKQIFSAEMEADFAYHIKSMARMFYGLSKKKCLQFAYEFAVKNNSKIPENWTRNQAAGQDWWLAFKKRQHLSIREPEATSIGRASAFNRATHKEFFDNLSSVMDKHRFQPWQIYNVDETGCTTAQKPGAVVAETGAKQVGSITSAERGELVTVIYTVRADGMVLPPMLIFPRVNYKSWFIKGGPPGCIGTATRSGWVNEGEFVKYLHHVGNQTNCSKDRPILLIMDNHESHCSLKAIDTAKDLGIVLLTIPPHTSHRMQPLDVAVYGPFKLAYCRAMDSYMRSNPGKTLTIYEIPEFVKSAQMTAITQRNVTAGFAKTGIYPLSRDTFDEDDFAPATVTDRPNPATLLSDGRKDEVNESTDDHPLATVTAPENPSLHAVENSSEISNLEVQERNFNKANEHTDLPTCSKYVSPTEIYPPPKAQERKLNRPNPRKGKTKVLTNTPVRNQIACEIAQQRAKKRGKEPSGKDEKAKTSIKRKLFQSKKARANNMSSSEEEDNMEADRELLDTDSDLETDEEVIEGDFVVVELQGKGRKLHFIARIDNLEEDGLVGVFLKKVPSKIDGQTPKFTLNEADESSFVRKDIVCKLPTPTLVGGNARLMNYFTFPHCNLKKWELK